MIANRQVKIIFLSLIFVFTVLFYFSKTVTAFSIDSHGNDSRSCFGNKITLFDDEFNGKSINKSVWDVQTNGGTVKVSDGKLTLSSDGTTRFPFIQPIKSPVPDENTQDKYAIEIRMKYNDTTTPAGFIFQAVQPDPNYLGNLFSDVHGGVWNFGPLFNTGGDHVIGPRPDGNYHIYKFSYQSVAYYHIFMDGNLLKQGRGGPSPYFWLGSPSPILSKGSISIDYIRLTTLHDELCW